MTSALGLFLLENDIKKIYRADCEGGCVIVQKLVASTANYYWVVHFIGCCRARLYTVHRQTMVTCTASLPQTCCAYDGWKIQALEDQIILRGPHRAAHICTSTGQILCLGENIQCDSGSSVVESCGVLVSATRHNSEYTLTRMNLFTIAWGLRKNYIAGATIILCLRDYAGDNFEPALVDLLLWYVVCRMYEP